MKFSKIIVAFIIAINTLFCIAALYINYRGYAVSDSLVVSWFGFTTAELWGLAFIKGKEIKHSDDSTDCGCEEDLKGDEDFEQN